MATVTGASCYAPDLATILSKHPQLTTFASLLKRVDLFDFAASLDNVTVIAPTDQAYLDLAHWGFNMSEVPAAVARALLQYHIVDGVHVSQSISDQNHRPVVAHTYLKPPVLTNVTDGAALKLSRDAASGKVITSSGLGVIGGTEEQDIFFDGGVIHTLNSSMVLPHNISITTAVNGLTKFLGLMSEAGVVEEFESLKDATIFIPSNRALEQVFGLMKSQPRSHLAILLRSHIVPGKVVYRKDLAHTRSLRTLADTKLSLHHDRRGIMHVDKAKILREDIILYGGVVHVIDRVLVDVADLVAEGPLVDADSDFEEHEEEVLAYAMQGAQLPLLR